MLKEKGKICYIVPLNILSTNDLDVMRYHLAKYTTIEKIITFENPMFIGRGLKQRAKVATSSLVFVARKEHPGKNHKVSIVNFQTDTEKQNDNLEKIFKSRNKTAASILQSELLENAENWSFIQQNPAVLEMIKTYNKNTESMALYAEHETAKKEFHGDFWFDVGFILDKKYKTQYSQTSYPILDFKLCSGYSQFKFNLYYPKDIKKIGLTKNSQGYEGLGHKYYIVWRIKNMQHFHFAEHPLIFNMGKAGFIGADNKAEMLYLFALLNSSVNKLILNHNLRVKNEKEFLVAIKSIKQYIRIPVITAKNEVIKTEIVKQTEFMLDLEKFRLRDFVDFPETSMQVFEDMRIAGNNLVLCKGNKIYTAAIKAGGLDMVKKAISSKHLTKNILISKKEVRLDDIRFLPAIDTDKQKQIKMYIDDLVFALYFDIDIHKVNIKNAGIIHEMCVKSGYYTLFTA